MLNAHAKEVLERSHILHGECILEVVMMCRSSGIDEADRILSSTYKRRKAMELFRLYTKMDESAFA